MLESIFILLEILAFIFATRAYIGFTSEKKEQKALVFWILATVTFGILAVAGYNIQVTLDASITNVVQIPIAVFNMGFSLMMITMLFIDGFNQGI